MSISLEPNMSTTLAEAGISLSKPLVIKSTSKSPSVRFVPMKEYLLIKDKSCTWTDSSVFRAINTSLDNYLLMGKENLTVHFKLERFEPESVKNIFSLVKRIKGSTEKGLNVDVIWYYTEWDDDMKEMGEDLGNMFDLNFKLTPYFANWNEVESIKKRDMLSF